MSEKKDETTGREHDVTEADTEPTDQILNRTIPELAAVFGIPRAAVEHAIRTGDLPVLSKYPHEEYEIAIAALDFKAYQNGEAPPLYQYVFWLEDGPSPDPTELSGAAYIGRHSRLGHDSFLFPGNLGEEELAILRRVGFKIFSGDDFNETTLPEPGDRAILVALERAFPLDPDALYRGHSIADLAEAIGADEESVQKAIASREKMTAEILASWLNDSSNPTKTYTTIELARELGQDEATILAAIKSGRLKPIGIRKRKYFRISKKAIDDFRKELGAKRGKRFLIWEQKGKWPDLLESMSASIRQEFQNPLGYQVIELSRKLEIEEAIALVRLGIRVYSEIGFKDYEKERAGDFNKD